MSEGSGPSVALLDYGSGNLRSAFRALVRAGARVRLTADVAEAEDADGLVVPGVGAYAACMAGLVEVGGDALVRRRLAEGRPVLGICVGHQVMFDHGIEHGLDTAGIGAVPGRVERLPVARLPHMGWNTVEPAPGSALFAGVEGERFYFVHSYAVTELDGPGVTWSEHGGHRFVAAVERGALAATQFHPEKSGDAGARVLANWVERLV